MKNQLTVGNMAFVRKLGKVMQIIGATNNQWIMSDTDLAEGTPILKKYAEPLVMDVFAIGDKVKSEYTFVGKVTGFETASNRVIVISDKIGDYKGHDCDRVRYAYKPNELTNLNNIRALNLNCIYELQFDDQPNVLTVRILEHPTQPDMYALHAVNTGKYLFALDKNIKVGGLPGVGIINYKKVKI